VVTGNGDGTARIWDAGNGAQLKILRGDRRDEVNSAVFSPDGERVVTASEDQTARIWDADSGAQLMRLPGYGGYVESAAFSPDGERVVTGNGDGTARIWDADNGAQLKILRGDRLVGSTAAFSPDGDRVETAGARVRIWPCGVACASVTALLELASQRAGTLSASERAQYLPE
jgi:WD40 repeat protein